MPQHQDFGFKPASRLEAVAQHADEKEGNCEHPTICSDSLAFANPMDRVFGTDKARQELGHPYKQCAITAAKSKTRRCPPQNNVELMAKKQVLSLKSAARLEQVYDEHSKRVQDCKHRSQ